MMNKKWLIAVCAANFILSMSIVYLSPRFDFVTMCLFLVENIIILLVLKYFSRKRELDIENKIENLFTLIQSLDIDSVSFEVEDSDFGKLRDEIVKIILENKRIAESATKNSTTLREYTEDLSHQIKTPLTGILLMLDLIDEDPENAKQYAEFIRKNINRLHLLTDILLKMSALESGSISMKKDDVDVIELIDEIKEDIKSYFIKINPDIPVYGDNLHILCDRQWTYEALFNIVKNGIEASPDNCVEIHFKETRLYKSILVVDFSEGMSNAMLKKAFKRFYREKPDSKGFGIGLPMAKSIMEKQNGELIYHRGKTSNHFELRFYI